VYNHTTKVFFFLALLVSIALFSSNFAFADHGVGNPNPTNDPNHLVVDNPNFVIDTPVQYDFVTIANGGTLTITPNGKLTVGSPPQDNDPVILIFPNGELIVEADLTVEPRNNGEVISWGLVYFGTITVDGTYDEFEGLLKKANGVIFERCGKFTKDPAASANISPFTQPHPDGCPENITIIEQNKWTLAGGDVYLVEPNHELIITGESFINGLVENKGTIRNISPVVFAGGEIKSIGSASKIWHVCQKFEDGGAGTSGFFGSGQWPEEGNGQFFVGSTTCAKPTAIDDGSDVMPFASTNADVILTSDSSINVMLGAGNDFDADFILGSTTYDEEVVDFLPELTTSAGTLSDKGGIVGMNPDGTFSYDPNGQFDSLKLGLLDTDTFTYTLDDGTGGTDTAIVTIGIIGVSNDPPVIAIEPPNPAFIEVTATYVDAGATCSDKEDGPITVVVSGLPVDTSVVTSATVNYSCTDSDGNIALDSRTVNVIDTTIPVITRLGSDTVNAELNGGAYVDAGATASDVADGDITGSIVTVNPVDVSTLGAYVVTYNVDDSQNNSAVEVTRTVNVVDTTDPVISLIGSSSVTIVTSSATYTELGATVADNDPATISPAIVGGDTVDESTLGTYVVTYNRDDPSGNSATEVIRTVNVVTNNPPVITILGNNPESVIVGDVYVDAGATYSDIEDGITDEPVTDVEDNVNTAVAGDYTVVYSVTDSDDNTTEAFRDVTVENLPNFPTITILGNNPESVIVDDVYVDAGATCSDTEDGLFPADVVSGLPVDTSEVTSTTVDYSCKNSDGNITLDSRTVTVLEESPDSLRFLKFEQIKILESLIEDSSKKTQKELEKSIKEINKSLADKSWIDDSTLDSKHGKKVFDHEKHAVQSLTKINNPTDVSGVIDTLVQIDRTLASDAIDELDTPENEDNDKVQKELEKSKKELEKGDEKAAEGKFDKAIDKYKKAWEHTQHAIKHL